ncbi:S41 family peptidase [Massilibacteroides sp.]|uniref:S41 family peptidase n=1 Tax=Massilibacteroides sp. TaxID=2034766 RepID=UPI002636F71C|nr:S41 family peptidase [Massilibacteroides sp.]MDD4515236.1 S41 family peptidase [Massilibacteroides sp.]
MNKLIYATFALLLLFFSSCEKDTSLDKKPVNEWIYETMEKYYYWYDKLPAISKTDLNAKPDVFFESLLYSGDGKDGLHYSRIEEEVDTKSGSISTTYGFNYGFVIFSENATNVYMRVNYTISGAPAEEAGLQHGDWISSYNGIQLTSGNYTDFIESRGEVVLSVGKIVNRKFVKTHDVTIRAAVSMAENPIYIDTTYLVNNKKISYLMYNSFVSGPEDYNDETYDNQLKTVFANFAGQNPDEFILDLRYNPGGLLSSAQVLATLLAPQSALDKQFCRLIYNEKLNKTVEYNLDKSILGSGNSLNLNRLFIITSERTASSSELIINGLRPYIDIVLVGGVTEGKNVGSNEYSDKTNHNWVLHPITCLVENSEGFSDYSNGFNPDFPLDEISQFTDIKPLGDTEELMLGGVLGIIENGTLPVKYLKSAEAEISVLPLPHKQIEGIIIN